MLDFAPELHLVAVLGGFSMGKEFSGCPISATTRSFTESGQTRGPLRGALSRLGSGPLDRAARPATVRIAHQSYTARWDSTALPAGAQRGPTLALTAKSGSRGKIHDRN